MTHNMRLSTVLYHGSIAAAVILGVAALALLAHGGVESVAGAGCAAVFAAFFAALAVDLRARRRAQKDQPLPLPLHVNPVILATTMAPLSMLEQTQAQQLAATLPPAPAPVPAPAPKGPPAEEAAAAAAQGENDRASLLQEAALAAAADYDADEEGVPQQKIRK